jgi:thymidylate kinase
VRTCVVTHPPLICLTGIDGCGKSTQVRLLADRLRAEGWETATVWTGGRPYISRPLVRLVKWRFRAPVQRADGRFESRDGAASADVEFSRYLSKSNQMFRRHRILRRGWTDVSLVEHAVEANLTVRPHLRRGQAVVCDRYLYKSIVNLAVLLDLPLVELPRLLRHPALKLVPQPTLYFLLDVPAEVGYQRKYDLPGRAYVERRVPIYRALAAWTGMPVVDATQPPAVVAEAIWDITRQALEGEEFHPAKLTG